MSTDAPQLPTPDFNNTSSYNNLLDTMQTAAEPTPATEAPTQANGSYKDTVINSAQSAMETVQSHPITQQAVNGPVGQSVKNETVKTQSEFRDLADARRTPEQPAATGQPLTHYHSMFYRLLSWKNPRATGISFACSILFIFAARYLNIVRYVFKALYLILGTTALAEIAGKSVMGHGLASQMRPRKYYMIRKDSLERLTDDLEQLINFFIIEFQRIVFAENLYVTCTSFVATFISYWLIKWVPLWGLTLIATTSVYLGPLIYIQNREFIDEKILHTNHVLNEQANQFKELAAHHSARAQETVKTYATEYSAKAQEMIGQAKNKATGATSKSQPTATPAMAQEKHEVNEGDFPAAPKEEPKLEATEAEAPFTGTAVPEPAI